MNDQDNDGRDRFSHTEGGSVPQTKRTHPDDITAATPNRGTGRGSGSGGSLPGNSAGNPSIARAVYILYFVGMILNFAALMGFVLAWSYRKEARGTWVASHFQWQIRTFWIGFGMILGAFLALAYGANSLGLMTMFGWMIWALTRTIKGWKLFSAGKAIPDPETLWW